MDGNGKRSLEQLGNSSRVQRVERCVLKFVGLLQELQQLPPDEFERQLGELERVLWLWDESHSPSPLPSDSATPSAPG